MEYDDIEWEDLTFDEKLFCNSVEYAFANNRAELIARLEKEDPRMFSIAKMFLGIE